jgi:hypothetical protein
LSTVRALILVSRSLLLGDFVSAPITADGTERQSARRDNSSKAEKDDASLVEAIEPMPVGST